MQRYSKIYEKNPREIVLLKSLPCVYGKCTFCNYILDNSLDVNEINAINREVIALITGEFGVLEVINSGSVFEIPKPMLDNIKSIADTKNIKTLYFEAYYGYRKRLPEMCQFFNQQQIRYRIGIETFDDEFREKVLNKPFPTDNIVELSREFYCCMLLICIEGQTRAQILNDINIARTNFKEVIINVFVNNTTKIKRDESLVEWFIKDIYPNLKDIPNVETLIDNKDLGVFVQ
ncbi:MAG: hypothetical protein KBD37_04315 [Burkholderiales bacterium]|nr:hypothetical protein [Burkholderiales bacterium]